MRKLSTTNDLVAVLKNGVIRYHNRDIVMVLVNGKRQPFYKSSGRSSDKAGEWLPFDGIQYPDSLAAWFDKTAYVINPECPDAYHGFGDLHRYGTNENFEVSQALKQTHIPEGIETDSAMDVNFFLGVLDVYSNRTQRQAWARNKGWGVCNLPSSGQEHNRTALRQGNQA